MTKEEKQALAQQAYDKAVSWITAAVRNAC